MALRRAVTISACSTFYLFLKWNGDFQVPCLLDWKLEVSFDHIRVYIYSVFLINRIFMLPFKFSPTITAFYFEPLSFIRDVIIEMVRFKSTILLFSVH